MGQADVTAHPGGKSGQAGRSEDNQERKVGHAGGSEHPGGKSGTDRWIRTYRREKWDSR